MSRVSVAALLVLASVASVGCADNMLKERPAAKAVRATAAEADVLGGGAAPRGSRACAGRIGGSSGWCSSGR